MTRMDRLLRDVLSIAVGTPYPGKIVASTSKGDSTLHGDVIFSLTPGHLDFRFYSAHGSYPGDAYKLYSRTGSEDAQVRLHIPSQDFVQDVYLYGLPSVTVGPGLAPTREGLLGRLSSHFFGNPVAPLNSATLYIRSLPDDHWGTREYSYHSYVAKGEDEVHRSGKVLNSSILSGGGWMIDLCQLPDEWASLGEGTHTCTIARRNAETFTGNRARALLINDLYPFLSLMFGQHIDVAVIEGGGQGGGPALRWGSIRPPLSTTSTPPVENWFTGQTQPPDPTPLFEQFCALNDVTKGHFRKVIEKYTISQTLAGTSMAGTMEVALATSFSALEGLVRSIISTYRCGGEWLDATLALRGRGKSIGKAINMVVETELGRLVEQDALIAALKAIRNATVHTDLASDDSDPMEARFRWEQCQFLVEALLLARLGAKEIPNRTSRGKFEVLGIDMLEDVRRYEIQTDYSSEVSE